MMHDVIVIGAGPSGLTVAGALAARGLDVSCVAPEPQKRWPQSLGLWRADLPSDVDWVESEWTRPLVWFGDERCALDENYVRADTARLQGHLLDAFRAAGGTVTDAKVTHIDHGAISMVTLEGGVERRARLVVDASGARSPYVARPRGPVGYQCAFSVLADVNEHPYRDTEMSLMDLSGDEAGPPGFLYALPLGPRRVFLEETVLASRKPLADRVLRQRLARRLERMGIRIERAIAEARCCNPLGTPLPNRGQRTVAFGAAASFIHPATGYQLGRALRLAPAVVEAIVSGLAGGGPEEASRRAYAAMWPDDAVLGWGLYGFGMEVACELRMHEMRDLYRAFFDMPTALWRGYMCGTLTSAEIASAMARVFVGAPSLRAKFVAKAALSRRTRGLLGTFLERRNA